MSLTRAAHLLYDEYREGRFPMAETADDPFMIVTPHERALIPIEKLHISTSLLKKVKRGAYEVRVDTAFDEVIRACAESNPSRPETWISPDIRLLFNELHRLGRAHSIECFSGDALVGGLYGLAVGGVFCGESMFSRATDASKVALVHLCARLFTAKFTLLDAQFHNRHLEQFGLYLIPQGSYEQELRCHRDDERDFLLRGNPLTEKELVVSYLQSRQS